MQAQNSWSGAWTCAVPGLVQCSFWCVGSGVFVGDFSKGSIQPSSVQGLRCRLRSVCQGLQQGQDTGCFCAGTEMWALQYVLVDLTRAWPRLVHCRDQDVSSGVFVGVLNKGRTLAGSGQGSGVSSGALNRGRTHLISEGGSELWAHGCLPGAWTKERPSLLQCRE